MSGCASSASAIRARFAKERRCPTAQVSVSEVGGSAATYRATGCGVEATYVCEGVAGFASAADARCTEQGVRSSVPSEERTRPPENYRVFPAPTAR